MKSKTKRRLSTLMALALVFGLCAAMPMTASAATINLGDASDYWRCLADAENGDTIRLTASITRYEPSTIRKSITIDLNGFNLSIDSSGISGLNEGLHIDGDCTVTVKGPGTLTVRGSRHGVYSTGGSTLNMTGGAIINAVGGSRGIDYAVSASGGRKVTV